MVNEEAHRINLDMNNVKDFPYEAYLVVCAQAEKAKDLGKIIMLYFPSPLSV